MRKLLYIAALSFTATATAMPQPDPTFPPFYVSASFGVFQGNFNSTYTDLTDVIPQNIAQSFQQYGYTEALAVGFQRRYLDEYVLAAQLSVNFDSHNASFKSGASTTAFSDNIRIENHFDLTFVPGIMLNPSIEAYLKLGFSRGYVSDSLVSPTGYTPAIQTVNSSQHVNGFAGGLGLKKSVYKNFSVFVEGNYHDYGTVNLSNFQNFTASYANKTHLLSYDAAAGVIYNF